MALAREVGSLTCGDAIIVTLVDTDGSGRNIMSDETEKAELERPPVRSWDYSSDPLKEGGMQIATTVVGFLIVVLLTGVGVLVWFLVR
jgi:hypothetical protein